MKRLVVALTGGIGTGKSTALEAFGRCGAQTVSADVLAHELSRPGRPLFRSIVRAFGDSFVASTGELDRAALAGRVFRSPAMRRKLERATHPAIMREMQRRIMQSRKPVVVADVPLLFEARLQARFDATMTISAPESAVLRRLRRRGMGRSEALRRMRAQWPLRKKEALADVILRNDGSRAALSRRVKEYYQAFELIAKSRTN